MWRQRRGRRRWLPSPVPSPSLPKTEPWRWPEWPTRTDTNTDTTQTAWLSGGTAGAHYDVVYQITTNQSRTDDRTVRITVEDR